MAQAGEFLHHALGVVALHLDHAVFHRAAAAAGGLQLFAQRGECGGVERQAFDQRDGLAPTALGFAPHTGHAVARGRGGRGFAHTRRHGLAAGGTHATAVGGIHQPGGGRCLGECILKSVFHGQNGPYRLMVLVFQLCFLTALRRAGLASVVARGLARSSHSKVSTCDKKRRR